MERSLGSSAQHKAQINMTPMIDILLVLIIIFMVITPLTPRGLRTLVPQPPRSDRKQPALTHDIVITVRWHGTVRLNLEPVRIADLQPRLELLFKTNTDHVIFVRAEKDLPMAQG
ncbi:MAG: biopolymer transporter ExbD [Bryobacteraceae bacterium]|jgi:biopolymer transport protein ExbD